MPGTSNQAADAASRYPSPSAPIETLNTIDIMEHALAAAIQCEAAEISSLPWSRIVEETSRDDQMRALVHTVESGFPEADRTLPHAAPYWQFRHALYISDGAVMFEDRVIIPPSLRRMVLNTLHAAHQGTSSMELRARAIVFWPGITADIHAIRAGCSECNKNAPSQPSLPATATSPPSTPFESVYADFFDFAGAHFLAVGDRLSGWTEVFSCPTGSAYAGAKGLIGCLRRLFATFGVPEELSSDGGPEFSASLTQAFLKRWCVTHRISTAYNPQSNGRAEVAVKATKRLLRSNIGPNGSLDSDRFIQALLQQRNTPDPDCNISPAQVIFGKPLKDSLSFVNRLEKFSNPHIRPAWREAWSLKESSLKTRYTRSQEALDAHTRTQRPLRVGDRCFIQNGAGNFPKRWDRTGVVTEVLPYDKYSLRVDGSGRVTSRNRKSLRQFTGVSTDILLPAPGAATALAPPTPATPLPTADALAPPTQTTPSHTRLLRSNIGPTSPITPISPLPAMNLEPDPGIQPNLSPPPSSMPAVGPVAGSAPKSARVPHALKRLMAHNMAGEQEDPQVGPSDEANGPTLRRSQRLQGRTSSR